MKKKKKRDEEYSYKNYWEKKQNQTKQNKTRRNKTFLGILDLNLREREVSVKWIVL